MEPWNCLASSSKQVLCEVCGKLSSGLHYGVQTCHGCKSFFRRAIINYTRYPPCFRNQKCYEDLNLGKRPKKCQHCRITKCFNVGMDSEAFLVRTIMTKNEKMSWIIDYLSRVEIQIDTFRKSAYNPITYPSLEEALKSIPCLSKGQKYGPMQGWPLSIEDFRGKRSRQDSNSNMKNWLAFDLIATIEYAKTFSFIHQLSHNDRNLLVKATTFMNYELLRVFYSYSNKYEFVQLPDGTSNYERVCIAANNRDVANLVHKISEKPMGKLIRESFEKQEYVLLKAIVFCNNAVTDLSSRGQKIIQRERYKYCSALFLYCKTRYGVKNGPARFGSILSMVDVLERSQQQLRNVLLLENMKEKTVTGSQSNPTSLADEILNI